MQPFRSPKCNLSGALKDCVFLRLVLLQIGLILEATDWIMGCVNYANLSILKNTPGLRQGSLSPQRFKKY
jgi:hypothetical protein